MSQHIKGRVLLPRDTGRPTVRGLLLPTHHVQAAAVHQGGELMQADLRGVQDPLDLFQTSLEMDKEQN